MNHYLPQVYQRPLENRLEKANEWIKKIDSNLKLIFIPRTLYELFYILSAFAEEIDLSSKKYIGCIREGEKETSICWHSYQFQGWTDKNNLDPEIIELAFRLNQIIIKALNPSIRGMTKRQ